jgi:cobalt-precorrin 5A hydrolase/precorrin-3B C17-methyltransferase
VRERAVIGLFAPTAAGADAARDVASALGADAVVVDGPVAQGTRGMWARLDAAIFFLGTGATVRLIAPLLGAHEAPAVVCAEDGSDYVVALLGGADSGGNAVAARIADVLGRTGVFAAGTEVTGTSALDELAERLDAKLDGDVAGCVEAARRGESILLLNPLGVDVNALPDNYVSSVTDPQWTVLVDDRIPEKPLPGNVIRLIPRTLVVGIGATSGIGKDRVADLVARVGIGERFDLRAVKIFATVDRKAQEAGIVDAMEDHAFWCDDPDVTLVGFAPEELSEVDVPNPSATVRARIGTPSVAEAAALLAARKLDPAAVLAVPKITGQQVTVAVARIGRGFDG